MEKGGSRLAITLNRKRELFGRALWKSPLEEPFGPLEEPFGPLEEPFGPLEEPFGPLEEPFGPLEEL